MSQLPSNSCAQGARGLPARSDNLPQRHAGGTQKIVLRMRVDPRRRRGVGVTEPLRDHR